MFDVKFIRLLASRQTTAWFPPKFYKFHSSRHGRESFEPDTDRIYIFIVLKYKHDGTASDYGRKFTLQTA